MLVALTLLFCSIAAIPTFSIYAIECFSHGEFSETYFLLKSRDADYFYGDQKISKLFEAHPSQAVGLIVDYKYAKNGCNGNEWLVMEDMIWKFIDARSCKEFVKDYLKPDTSRGKLASTPTDMKKELIQT